MEEYQFTKEMLDEAVLNAIEAYNNGNADELEKQRRIIQFWDMQLDKIMEEQIYEEQNH